MDTQYDAIVIGAGLGGLTAAATLAQRGCKTLLIERNYSVGGAASTYKSGEMVVEGSLHETANPHDPLEPKHHILRGLGVLDKITWVPAGSVYEARGGPLGSVPFVLPDGFGEARAALIDRFPALRIGIGDVLSDMERITAGLGVLSQGRAAFDKPLTGLSALLKLAPVVTGWRHSVAQRLQRAFGDDEGAKAALAANMLYWHDDPDQLWWMLFALGQGGYIGSGGCFVQGGSQRLSSAIARAFRAAGGEIVLHRRVTEILLDAHGLPIGVAHIGKKDGERVEVRARVVVSNAAPSHMAEILPPERRATFAAPYIKQRLSISLFSATFGLTRRPQELGLASYSTMLLPEWMRTLADYKRGAALLAEAPGEAMPPVAVVNYAAIDSGLGGPPYPVSVVGADRLANWQGMDSAAYAAKRDVWMKALVAALDGAYPGFVENVVTSVMSTASSMNSYLDAPAGAVHGFAPTPPGGPIWRGTGRSPRTPIDRLFLASAYAGSGGYTGAILGGALAARHALAALPVSKK
jgi:phytoene dehydrogenase-like protein